MEQKMRIISSIAVAALLFAGCERFSVGPEEDFLSDIILRGTLGNEAVVWQPGEDGVVLTTATEDGAPGLANFVRTARLTKPAQTAGDDDESLTFELALRPKEWMALGVWSGHEPFGFSALDAFPAGGSNWLQPETPTGDATELQLFAFDVDAGEWELNGEDLETSDWQPVTAAGMAFPGAAAALRISIDDEPVELHFEAHGDDDECAHEITMTWFPQTSTCQTLWMPSPFDIFELAGAWFVRPPVFLPGYEWKWTIAGEVITQTQTSPEDAVPLPTDWEDEMLIELSPAHPDGALGNFLVTHELEFEPGCMALPAGWWLTGAGMADLALTIAYTNPSGQTFRTLPPCHPQSPSTADFLVATSTPFETSEQGHPTSLLDFEASVTLYRASDGTENWPPAPGTPLDELPVAFEDGSHLAFPDP